MGLDIGEKRIGVALSDPGGILASPFTIIERVDPEQDAEKIARIASEYEVGQIIAGLPLSMAGTIGDQARKVQEFVEGLSRRVGIPVEYRDERLSSVSAKRLMPRRSGRRGREKPRYDAAAAAVILQSYLEERRR